MLLDKNLWNEVFEEREDKLVKDMTDDEFDDMLKQLILKKRELKQDRKILRCKLLSFLFKDVIICLWAMIF